jgi:hypothetical protein
MKSNFYTKVKKKQTTANQGIATVHLHTHTNTKKNSFLDKDEQTKKRKEMRNKTWKK